MPFEVRNCKKCGRSFQIRVESTEFFCSASCKTQFQWDTQARIDSANSRRRFLISREDLDYRVNILGQSDKMIASIFHKKARTVRRLRAKWGIRRNVVGALRQIWLPTDKTVFLLRANPEIAADVELLLKAALAYERLRAFVDLDVIEPIREAITAQITTEEQRAKDDDSE